MTISKSFFSSVSLLILLAYTLSALALTGPLTPLSIAMMPLTSSIQPMFSQNWQLFGPDPINEERGLLARVRCEGGDTPWVDLSREGVQQSQGSRFFPPRQSRFVSNLLVARFSQDDVSSRLNETDRSEEFPELEKQRRSEIADAELVLARYASKKITCADGSPVGVKLRYVFHAFPGWSHRESSDVIGDVTTIDSDWISVE